MKHLISIDIGSTFTKGIIVRLNENSDLSYFDNLFYYKVPTTVNNLSEGFFQVYEKLIESLKEEIKDLEIYYSSSAKGGLNIVAIGIVPQLTLKVAKLTALSAGGKISASFSYKISPTDIESINKINPDIILFTGGTNGGNEQINLHNAQMLTRLNIRPVIIYAGNETLKEQIFNILKDFNIVFSKNVLPEIDKMNVDDAKESIRQMFLKTIIHGKGLDKISDRIGFLPNPTPFSVFEFVKKFGHTTQKIKDLFIKNEKSIEKINNNKIIENLNYDFSRFCLIDMGGATTDFYSNSRDLIEDSGIILKGLPEPDIKRTVEGDLGMRVSAKAAISTSDDFIMQNLRIFFPQEDHDNIRNEFYQFIEKVNTYTDYIVNNNEKEAIFDKILASLCVRFSALRHVGRHKRIFTINGEKIVQEGKNLKNVSTIIGTGGYLSYMDNFNPKYFLTFNEDFSNQEEIPLLPQSFEYFQDEKYIIPLISNLSFDYPDESTIFVLSNIKKI